MTEQQPVTTFESVEAMTKAIKENPASVGFRRAPKPSCKKCYGRGWVGRNLKTGLYVPCRCCK